MKKLIALVVALCLCLAVCAPSFAEGVPASLAEGTEAYTDFAFLSTTDMHGKCWDTNLLTGYPETHNMLRVSTAVRQVRGEFGEENVLLLDNGDLFQGTPVSQCQLFLKAAGKSEDPLAMALCLEEIGYDALTLGNHEFNYPWAVMSETYAWLEENGVAVLAANAVWDGTDPGHPAGENVFTPYIVRTVTVNGHEHKIGVLGLENGDITRWDIPANYPGVRFAHAENETWSSAYEANLYIPKMREEGCEFIAVCYHGGLGDSDLPLSFGLNTENQGRRIAEEAEGVDLLIVGHDHSTAYTNTAVPGPSGKDVLVVNGGGQELTKAVFRFSEDETGALRWELLSAENLDPSAYDADPELEAKIRPYADLAAADVEAPVGAAAGEWDGNNAFYTGQTDSMDLVSAAMMYAGTEGMERKYGASGLDALEAAAGLDHLDVDMAMAACASTGYTIRAGELGMKDIYRLYRYANSLLVLPMYGRDIRAVMEENAENRLSVRVIWNEARFFSKGDEFTHILFGGVNFEYDMSAPAGERVTILGFANGRVFEEDALYLVTVNNYTLGNERCGLRSWTAEDTLWSQAEEGGDKNIQDAIADYVRHETEEKGALTPDAFNWEWKITYSADPAALPAYTGRIAAWLVSRPADGQSVVIYNEADGCVMTGRTSGRGLGRANVGAYGNALVETLPEEALVLTARVDAEGRFAFTAPDGRYLSAVSGGLWLTDGPAEGNRSLWTLRRAEGGWNILSAGDDSQAVELYSGVFTTYRPENTSAYLFNFYAPKE